MTGIVYTYYEKINETPPGTLAVWEESWRKHGWNTRVLGSAQFQSHPAADFYDACTDKLPTFNNRIYERACYRRWLAMNLVMGGLMTDYDVVNRGFRPEHLDVPAMKRLTILCENLVPCVVFGSAAQYYDAALHFAEYVPTDKDVYKHPGHPAETDPNHGKPLVEDMTIIRHTSDMHILARTTPDWFESRPICCDVGDLWTNPVGYASTKLVHCSAYGTARVRATDRTALMRSFLT